MLFCVISYYIILCYIISCYIILCYVTCVNKVLTNGAQVCQGILDNIYINKLFQKKLGSAHSTESFLISHADQEWSNNFSNRHLTAKNAKRNMQPSCISKFNQVFHHSEI